MKKIVVFGLARSGIAVINFLSKLDYEIQICDDQQESIDKILNLPNIIKCYDVSNIRWGGVESLILSPGVPLHFPEPHGIVKLANKNQIRIISDIEYFCQIFSKQNYIGITGTNGKSTSTTLISQIFQNSSKKFDFGGNIGRSIFNMAILPENSHYILELSSYQLDLIYQAHLKIAILLNVTPDHLIRHGNFKNYVIAKKRIFQNQGEGDFSVIGVDSKQTAAIYQELKDDRSFKANLIPFSIKNILTNGFAIKNHIIYENGQKIANLQGKILIKGDHNLENILASFVTCYLSKIDINIILNSIAKFTGLKHRMQFVKRIGNVSFINDSKATSLESTIMAIKNFDNIHLILGGEVKNDDFNLLKKYEKNICKCYLVGSSTDELHDILSDKIICKKNYNLESAINESYQEAKEFTIESNVLLSPAATSFDQWQDFEERGQFFIDCVTRLI
ncbi:MAG: UDP-N-acetylmuramoylalanine--D-glutamate ligase [Rickettsiales bacterium]|jgi:UDP-N-acetylmuramoylalanine--D-glutamate ligase